MALTRSKSINKNRSFVAATNKVAPRQTVNRTVGKPKKTPKKTATTVKVPVVPQPQDASATDDQQLPMIAIPTDVIYTLNNSRMQHFIEGIKVEIEQSVDSQESQSSKDPIGQDPNQRGGSANVMESPISNISTVAQFVEPTIPANDMNVRHATDFEDYGILKLEPSSPRRPRDMDSLTMKEEIPSPNESFKESMDHSREISSGNQLPAADTSTIPFSSRPARIKGNPRMDSDIKLEDFPDHLSQVSDVSMLSLDNPRVNGSAHYPSSSLSLSSHVLTLPSIREFSSTDPFHSPNCSPIEERRLCASSERTDSERMEISDELEEVPPYATDIQQQFVGEDFLSNVQSNCSSPARTIVKTELEDNCPSPARTIVKTDSGDECPSPTRTIEKEDLEDGCPSPARTIIKTESETEVWCPSPTRTIEKEDLEDDCPSPARTIIKSESETEDWSPSPTETTKMDEYSSTTKVRVAYAESSNKVLLEYRPSTENIRSCTKGEHAALPHSDQQRSRPERWHQNSLPRAEQANNKRCTATGGRSSSARPLYRAVFPIEMKSDGSYKEKIAKRKRDYEIDGRSDRERAKMKRNTVTSNGSGSRVDSDTTTDSEPDYGWEDPPPPKPKPEVRLQKSRDFDPRIQDKMKMFMSKLNNEYDLFVIESSKNELFEAIDESIAEQSTKKLNALDQTIQQMQDDYARGLFGTNIFESWNNDPALSNVMGIELNRNKASPIPVDASLMDKMTMKHLEKRT